MNNIRISRRQFLRLSAASDGAALLAACGAQATPAPTATSAPASAAVSSGGAGGADIEVMAKDVIDFALESDAWTGQFRRID